MVGDRGPGQVVDAVGHTFQYAVGHESLEGGPRDASRLRLATGYQPEAEPGL